VKLRALAPDDAPAVAALHATSWRSAYRGIVPDAFLDHDVVADRQAVWAARLQTDPSPQALGHVIEDADTGELIGFAYALRGHDPVWGTLVDNLHVHHHLAIEVGIRHDAPVGAAPAGGVQGSYGGRVVWRQGAQLHFIDPMRATISFANSTKATAPLELGSKTTPGRP
jgi:hypothetical protein